MITPRTRLLLSGPAATATAVVVLIAGAYAAAQRAGFAGDDFMILHRLQALRHPTDVLGFFHGEFFGYYRPFGFLAHAFDWAVAGADPRRFHQTNIVLHAVSALLVLLIGRELAPRSAAGAIAALLFALHASNHEAVVWISARFDLLATCFSLAAVWWMVRGAAGEHVVPPLLFLCALLSKESAVALPIAAAGFAVCGLRLGPARAVRYLVPWLAALVVYSVMRHLGGGVSAIGGSGRLPKLAAFAALLALLVFVAGERWLRVRQWLLTHRGAALAAAAGLLAAVCAAAAAGGGIGRIASEKLAVAGFALFHLGSPVLDVFDFPFYLNEGTTMYWLGGAIALGALGAVVAVLWRPLVDDDRLWFLGSLLAAAMLPISALTEGTRYLYLPSAALSLMVGVLGSGVRGRARVPALALLGVYLAVSGAQVVAKVRDWNWAGRMIAEGAQIADDALAPSCGEGHIVFLTEPVAVRSVYTHFLYETFEPPRGCMPATFQVLLRMMRVDGAVDVSRDGPSRIVMTVPGYRDNFVASADLRNFDRPIRGDAPMAIDTPLGQVRAERIGADEHLTLTLAPDADPSRIHFFYYSVGRMRRLN